MSAFSQACGIEALGMRDVVPYLEERFAGRLISTARGEQSRDVQKVLGDFVGQFPGSERFAFLELKVESSDHTGNFFLETWSNRQRFTPGWMIHLSTDVLLYYFLNCRVLCWIDYRRLREWAFHDERLYEFPEKRQSRYDQLNDTWGRCVPIGTVFDEVGFEWFELREGPALLSGPEAQSATGAEG